MPEQEGTATGSGPSEDSLFGLNEFRVHAAHDWVSDAVTMTLAPGELGCIVGALGSGKSLLAEALAGIARPDVRATGTLHVPRVAQLGTQERRKTTRRVSFVPQDPRLVALPTDRVDTLLRARFQRQPPLLSRLLGMPKRLWTVPAWRSGADALLERLRLTPARILPLELRALSGSERQRILLALAVAEKNPLLVYDGLGEGLDPDDRKRVAELLRDVLARGGIVLGTARKLEELDLPVSQTVTLGAAADRSSALPLLSKGPAALLQVASGKPLLEVTRLRVARGKWQVRAQKRDAYPVDGATFFIRHGESLVLLGAAGSGKTTLLETLAGLERRAAGRVTLSGHDVNAAQRERGTRTRREVQLVFQDAAAVLDPGRTVRQHLEEANRLASRLDARERGVTQRPHDARAHSTPAEWLGLLGLPERLLDLSADFLSTGEAQRLDLGRSLVLAPRVVLFDAPRVAGTDSDGGALASLILGEKRHGKSFLIATSDPATAASLGDRIAVLYAGRIVEVGSAPAMIRTPAHPATLALYQGDLGAATDPRLPAPGCPFTASCPRALPQCATAEPALAPHPTRRDDGNHRVACFNPLP